jgi:hypothetical protein
LKYDKPKNLLVSTEGFTVPEFFVQSYQIHAIPQNGFAQLYWVGLWYSMVLTNQIIRFVKSLKMVGYAIIQRFGGVTWVLEN